MRIVIAIFGVIWTYLGMFFFIAIFLGNDSVWKIITALFAFAFGAICFSAGIRNYKGGWAFVVGGSILVIDSFLWIVEIKKLFARYVK